MKEIKFTSISGLVGVFVQLGLAGYIVYALMGMIGNSELTPITWMDWVLPSLALISIFICFNGYTTINPNEYRIVQFMGKYQGTLAGNGFWFINPFYATFAGSFRTENYQTPELIVNEKAGTPIEIAAIISYKVKDTYAHTYNTEDVEAYVKNQFEISLRQHARIHTYTELVSDDHDFVEDLTAKAAVAGIEILEAKITHLSYTQEIAGAMLQKQQAQAMSEAKTIIVENAVAIAKHAAEEMNGNMTAADKSRFIANLIVVLCSERAAQPVVNVNGE